MNQCSGIFLAHFSLLGDKIKANETVKSFFDFFLRNNYAVSFAGTLDNASLMSYL